jgi:Ca2+-binding RTX toxin-like protein
MSSWAQRQRFLKLVCKGLYMKKIVNKKADFLKAATDISDAVDSGASPANPAVISQLNDLVSKFNPALTVGTDTFDFSFSKNAALNYVNGAGGSDVLYGGSKVDVLVGGAGDDAMFAGAGDDGLFGGAGNDLMFAGDGNDIMRGGAGNDRLFSERGKDEITGGIGDDVMGGGAGADRFIFNPNRAGEGADRITDFKIGEDKIVLKVADVLASTPGLLALAGNTTAFDAADLDVSDKWNLGASSDGDVVVFHPTGSIELDGVKFASNLTFGSILPALDLI